jgi:response regulator RpfG family c-di-GMP phosphodiesterase
MSANNEISLLLFEIDQTALEMCRRIISRHFPALIVHSTNDADCAIELFQEHKHDIVISDVFIPKKSGIELARQACAVKPDTLVLFVTGEQHLNERILLPHAKDLCLHHIINKPLLVTELIASITEAIAKITENKNLS